MILSTKTKKKVPHGLHGARLIGTEYARSPEGKDLILKTGEKGLKAVFRIDEYDADMDFIFWLKPELEYQLKALCKAMDGSRYRGKIFIRELMNKMVYLMAIEEVYYRNGKPILDLFGDPITHTKIAPKFFKYDQYKKPKLKESDFVIEKYLDGLELLPNEKTSSI
jgi:hypothetical protein